LMEAELTERIGPKHAKLSDREGNWHGTTTGSMVGLVAQGPGAATPGP